METNRDENERIHAYLNMIRNGISIVERQNLKISAKEELKLKLKDYEKFMLTFINRAG